MFINIRLFCIVINEYLLGNIIGYGCVAEKSLSANEIIGVLVSVDAPKDYSDPFLFNIFGYKWNFQPSIEQGINLLAYCNCYSDDLYLSFGGKDDFIKKVPILKPNVAFAWSTRDDNCLLVKTISAVKKGDELLCNRFIDDIEVFPIPTSVMEEQEQILSYPSLGYNLTSYNDNNIFEILNSIMEPITESDKNEALNMIKEAQKYLLNMKETEVETSVMKLHTNDIFLRDIARFFPVGSKEITDLLSDKKKFPRNKWANDVIISAISCSLYEELDILLSMSRPGIPT